MRVNETKQIPKDKTMKHRERERERDRCGWEAMVYAFVVLQYPSKPYSRGNEVLSFTLLSSQSYIIVTLYHF